MKVAHIHLRYTVAERRAAFVNGIRRMGYVPSFGLPERWGDNDILIVWNRINMGNVVAQKFQDAGQIVIVAENSVWGNDFLGRRWYSVARNYHNTDECFPLMGNHRWDGLGVELEPFRPKGGGLVILPQRGIGSAPTRMPAGWAERTQRIIGGRIRHHPGKRESKSLREDLDGVSAVYTWGSGAAVKALMWGCRVFSDMPNWIAVQNNTEEGRLSMFRRLAWAQRELHEIESGEAFACLLPS